MGAAERGGGGVGQRGDSSLVESHGAGLRVRLRRPNSPRAVLTIAKGKLLMGLAH
jgi:hypothetical protein